jgi:hypothetical protein
VILKPSADKPLSVAHISGDRLREAESLMAEIGLKSITALLDYLMHFYRSNKQ